MTDTRKQLEAIAKATGIKLTGGCDLKKGLTIDTGALRWIQYWNPLTNNGDCAVMCAELGIDTVWFDLYGYVACSINLVDSKVFEENYTDHNNDKLAAWRFAACSVAAQIGEVK